jgi:hypothetical protein
MILNNVETFKLAVDGETKMNVKFSSVYLPAGVVSLVCSNFSPAQLFGM